MGRVIHSQWEGEMVWLLWKGSWLKAESPCDQAVQLLSKHPILGNPRRSSLWLSTDAHSSTVRNRWRLTPPKLLSVDKRIHKHRLGTQRSVTQPWEGKKHWDYTEDINAKWGKPDTKGYRIDVSIYTECSQQVNPIESGRRVFSLMSFITKRRSDRVLQWPFLISFNGDKFSLCIFPQPWSLTWSSLHHPSPSPFIGARNWIQVLIHIKHASPHKAGTVWECRNKSIFSTN